MKLLDLKENLLINRHDHVEIFKNDIDTTEIFDGMWKDVPNQLLDLNLWLISSSKIRSNCLYLVVEV